MLEKLFGSNARAKLLIFFLSNPKQTYHMRELARKLNLRINSVRRELLNLQNLGILKSKKRTNKTIFWLNPKFILYPELEKIILKATGGKSEFVEKIKQLGTVKLAILSGFFAKNQISPIDLLLVGEIDREKLDNFLCELAKKKGKEINFTVFSEKEFKSRLICRDRFLREILTARKIIILNNLEFDFNNDLNIRPIDK